VPLTRVVSFSGFESAPVYSNIFAGTMGNLRLERRKQMAKTKEFMQLRLQFAQEHLTAIIQRMVREKDGGSGGGESNGSSEAGSAEMMG
jgi:hypothetical protein